MKVLDLFADTELIEVYSDVMEPVTMMKKEWQKKKEYKKRIADKVKKRQSDTCAHIKLRA